MNACCIALGGNLGNVVETMERALSQLEACDDIRVSQLSRVYETAPVGGRASPRYFNAAVRLDCKLSPEDLLLALQQIERQLGRQRATRWDARPIDLDILVYGDLTVSAPDLSIPHPHLWYRRFVLDPLMDVAASVTHPGWGITMSRLRNRLLQRPLPVAIAASDAMRGQALANKLRATFPGLQIVDGFENSEHAAIVLDLEQSEIPKVELPVALPKNWIRLIELPGSVDEAATSVLTAALDEPVLHNRPLRSMP